MLISCPYCGRVHDKKYDCGKKPKRKYSAGNNRDHPTDALRSQYAWQRVRQMVRERDNNLCQLCLINYPGGVRQYEYSNLSVHHIIPIEEDESKAFDEGNLITLCAAHHEIAEKDPGLRENLFAIARHNNTL